MAAGSFQNTYNEVHTDIYSLGSDINTVDPKGISFRMHPPTTIRTTTLTSRRGGARGESVILLQMKDKNFPQHICTFARKKRKHVMPSNMKSTDHAAATI